MAETLEQEQASKKDLRSNGSTAVVSLPGQMVMASAAPEPMQEATGVATGSDMQAALPPRKSSAEQVAANNSKGDAPIDATAATPESVVPALENDSISAKQGAEESLLAAPSLLPDPTVTATVQEETAKSAEAAVVTAGGAQ